MDSAKMVSALSAEERSRRLEDVLDPSVQLPDYYFAPFHAYETGNMSWEAALEAELASKAVHATVMDAANVAVDPDGDWKMREAFHATARRLLEEAGADMASVRCAVDLGSSVGLSSVAIAKAWPGVSVTGACATRFQPAPGSSPSAALHSIALIHRHPACWHPLERPTCMMAERTWLHKRRRS
jgi:hypothetical protein